MNKIIQYKKLTDICEIITGEWGTEITENSQNIVSVIRTTNFLNNGKIDIQNKELIKREIDKKKIEQKQLKRGDIIIEKSGGSPNQPVGRVVFFDLNINEVFLCNNFTSILRVKEDINSKYIFYFLRNNYKKNKVVKYQNKTTGIINLKLQNYLNESCIFLPELKIQNKIVNILDNLENIIEKNQNYLTHLGVLTKSLFTTMFGDIEKKFEYHKLSNICDVRDGTHDSPEYITTDKRFPLITSKNLKGDKIDFSEVNFISEADFNKINVRSKVDIGDILMPMIGTIGNPIIVKINKKFSIKNLALIKFKNSQIINTFLKFLLLSDYFNLIISQKNKGGTQKFLSLSDIRNFLIPVPPIELQNKFAERIEKIEKLKFTIMTVILKAYENMKKKELRKIKILEQFTEEYIDDLNVRMTHHSNAIEGNTLTLNETATIILDDTIPNAMSKREFLEVLNHSDALKFLLAELQNNTVDIYMIKEINKILLNRLNHNAGNFKTDYNYIRGANFETASPSETPYKMNEWFENMNFQLKNSNSDIEKIKIILEYHIKFERIHPFSDGNGRTGRLIMLALMLENNLTPFVITVENRAKYMDILRNQDIENFVSLVEPLIEEEKKRIIAFKKSASLQI